MAKTACKIEFHDGPHGPSAVRMHKGHSVNVMNYPRGTRLTTKEKARARKLLCKGTIVRKHGSYTVR